VLYFLECLLRMLGRSTPAGGCSNVSAGFFSLQFLAKLAPLFGPSVWPLFQHLSVVQSSKCWQMDLQVVATAGMDHTLIVNGNGELHITSGKDELSDVYLNIPLEPQSSLRLILSQPSTNRILQISANWSHAAFVTETGQVTKSFMFLNHGSEILS
jgi:hypothetical protein